MALDGLRVIRTLLGANITDILRLQHLQNWSAKLIFCAAKRDHATDFLDQLHWLPVQEIQKHSKLKGQTSLSVFI